MAPYSAYPPVGGGKLRVYHLLQELMLIGHHVTLWMVPPDEPASGWSSDGPQPVLRSIAARIRASPRSKVASLLSPLPEGVWARPPHEVHVQRAASEFDVVIVMQALVGRYGEAFEALGTPVILDQQNVESEISREVSRLSPTVVGRARARLDVWKWRRYERALIARIHHTVAVSELDAAAFRRLVPSASVAVRPSGADLRTLAYEDHTQNRGDRLIMTGTLGYLPNLDAARWMIDEILPLIRAVRPSVRLVLVGASAPESLGANNPYVEVAGRVPDVKPYLSAADLFVAPLRAGGGTRLKLLEAFAVGLPVVCTTTAALGLDAQDRIHIALADDRDGFAASVLRILDDQDARHSLATSARKLVERAYDWRAIALDYEADLLRVTAASGSAPIMA